MSCRLRPAISTERQLAALWAAAAVSAIVLRPVWIAATPLLRRCTFRALTGIPCPTCGTTRTALALLDLDLASAFVVNPLAALTGVVFIAGGVAAVPWLAVRGPMPSCGLRWTASWTAVVIGVLTANWLYLVATH